VRPNPDSVALAEAVVSGSVAVLLWVVVKSE